MHARREGFKRERLLAGLSKLVMFSSLLRFHSQALITSARPSLHSWRGCVNMIFLKSFSHYASVSTM
jgi:hypothetical protein